ncbi:MAG TPA: aldehyde dehydrogenase [Bacteroidetes bacterium]|nr:aldehyde dehydrogenase [Bacteroidota bacterium]
MIRIKNYIGGELKEPISGSYIDNIEPATGEVYSLIPDSDKEDVDLAVKAAQKASISWSQTSRDERSNILINIANGIESRMDAFVHAESKDNGKPLSLARKVDIPRAISNFKFFATSILHFSSESHDMDGYALNYTLREPIGVVGCISPWNLPLYLFSWKIAPALATGNCVIAKPSEVTPMTAFMLSDVCKDAGLPDGVLNIIHGLGPKVGAAITEHVDIKAISFTGGTETGRQIARTASPMFKKISLELGGKNPNIIFSDCDFEKALNTSIHSSFANQGQICLCGSRIFLQRPIYDKFKKAFIDKTKALVVGDPMDNKTNLGAIVSKPHYEKILSYIELAKEEGGKVISGGEAYKPEGRCKGGYFIKPTIIEGLSSSCRLNQEEVFGPLVCLIPFDKEEEVVEFANSTEYGLAASIWTTDLNKAHRMGRAIKSGIVWINCWLLRDLRTPFGGMKNSGVGREGGEEALRFFTEQKNVCVKV